MRRYKRRLRDPDGDDGDDGGGTDTRARPGMDRGGGFGLYPTPNPLIRRWRWRRWRRRQ